MAAPATISAHLESCDPATGEVIGRFEITPPARLPEMMERARRVQEEWARRPVRDRCTLLRRLRQVLHARRSEISEIVTREVGKPRIEALLSDVVGAMDGAGYFARNAPRLLRPEKVRPGNPIARSKRGRLVKEPFGVIGVIAPWNYPLSIPMGTLIPAVAAGNAVILKASELTPWCGALVGELFEQAGFPPGLVQVAQGDGTVGAALIEAGPAKLVFTGSVATGKRVAEACARKLIPCVLELGGKDAMIVLSDADLELASSAAVWGSFTNCGQACISVERIYVERGVAERFTQLCVEKTRKLKLSSGLDPDTEVGPMIRMSQVERVESQLRAAVARGAQIVQGGKRRPDLGPTFFEPTVVTDVDHSMALMHEETFGPVLAIRNVSNPDEAVQLANDSPFGLSASVWTRDAKRGRQIASQLQVGAVMINDVISYYGVCEAPHGGRRSSGWGRTHSHLGLAELVQVKYVDEDRLARWPKIWWFGYDEQLAAAVDGFLELVHAPGWKRRLSSARSAVGAMFRGHRI